MWFERLLKRRLLPAWLVRIAVRMLLRRSSRVRYQIDTESRQRQRMALVRKFRRSPIAIHTPDANQQHYEVPSRFFELVLGKWLKYSCCYWPQGVDDLDAAEEAMLDLTCQRAQLEDGMQVLDLGCGWGSLSLWIAQHYPHCQVTALSNSATQGDYIRHQAQTRHLTNLDVRTNNVVEVGLEPRFDRVLSIEMFEHMKNYALLLQKIAGWLKPEGLLFVHHFSHAEFMYEFDADDPQDLMARWYFAGGTMPSDDLLLYFPEHMRLRAHWRVSGQHYAKTLRAWLKKLRRQRSAVEALFAANQNPSPAKELYTHWELFFLICEETFRLHQGEEYLVSHLLLEKA